MRDDRATESVEQGMPYRGHRVVPRYEEEQREIVALAHAAKMRWVRAAAVLGALPVALGLAASAIASRPGGEPLCHHVRIELLQSSGRPPPPMEWTTCREPHDLTGRIERSRYE